jgi:hypothetical protein
MDFILSSKKKFFKLAHRKRPDRPCGGLYSKNWLILTHGNDNITKTRTGAGDKMAIQNLAGVFSYEKSIDSHFIFDGIFINWWLCT